MKATKIIALRFAVAVLENNRVELDDEGLSLEQEQDINNEYDKIIRRLYNIAVKNGGDFNRYIGS